MLPTAPLTAVLLLIDQARARELASFSRTRRSGTPGNVGISNTGVSYEANVGIGVPPTFYNMLVDTGSANTWIGALKPYVPDWQHVCVTYRSGAFCGKEVLETVTLSPTLVVYNHSGGFRGFDGVLGLGPVDLTIGTLSPDSALAVPTVTDNLFLQGTIPADLLSLYFEPATPGTSPASPAKSGELTFGGTDPTKFTDPMTTVPITATLPAKRYWGIDGTIVYGAPPPTVSPTILTSTAGILDSGTTLVLLATDAFARYKSQTGAVLDSTTGLLTITTAQYASLKSLYFVIGGKPFEFTANAQIWPRSLNSLIGGATSSIYLVINDIGTSTGSGLDFVNGYTFLERFYTAYDTTNRRIGIATTPFTIATTN
ncbi:aspartic peptidase domain-containing protein [Lactarius sanguifluus]|nr:aspartic peptidase domain-containing protein [Lactarius sanguifluus]